MKKFLIEPQVTPSRLHKADSMVETANVASQYGIANTPVVPANKKDNTWKIDGSWVVVTDSQGLTQRVPGEQIIQELLRQNSDLRTQVSQLQQEQRNMTSKLNGLTQALRQRT